MMAVRASHRSEHRPDHPTIHAHPITCQHSVCPAMLKHARTKTILPLSCVQLCSRGNNSTRNPQPAPRDAAHKHNTQLHSHVLTPRKYARDEDGRSAHQQQTNRAECMGGQTSNHQQRDTQEHISWMTQNGTRSGRHQLLHTANAASFHGSTV